MIDTMTCTTPRVAALSARSPAKINLILDVLGRRDDGFHELRSLVVGVDLADEMRFEDRPGRPLHLACDDPHVPADDTNLAWRAGQALAKRATDAACGARIELRKRIPVGGGLGGGSSNAATSLAALNRLWNVGLGAGELACIGAGLGSDVPLFFHLPSSIISGRGESVQPVTLSWSGWVLLVFAGVPVSTKDVYAAWSDMGGPTTARDRGDRYAEIARGTSAREVSGLCSNDLEPAVFRVSPAVRRLHEAVRGVGAAHARVSGAGQSIFVLFDEPEEAETFLLKLHSRRTGTGATVVKTLTAPLTIC